MIDSENTAIIRDTFIYLRTKLRLEDSNPAIKALAQYFPHDQELASIGRIGCVSVLEFDDGGLSWANGLICRVKHVKAPADIANILRPALQEFDGWVIQNCWGEYAEGPSGGLMERYFDRLWDGECRNDRRAGHVKLVPLAQLYLMHRENDPAANQTSENIRKSFKEDCLPAFYFRDGQVLMLNSNDPAKTIARRIERQVQRLKHWAVVDCDGVTWTATGEDNPQHDEDYSVWATTRLEDLEFVSDDVAMV